MKFDKRI